MQHLKTSNSSHYSVGPSLPMDQPVTITDRAVEEYYSKLAAV